MNLRKLLICLLPFLIATSCFGQVKVSVILDQQQFLPGEDVPVKVRIINHSGQTLFFGENNQWLRVSIQAQDSFVVRNTGDVPVRGVFELPPSKMATKELNIAPYFDLNRPGRYEVVATVRIEEWNQTITSMPASFDVISGSKLWRGPLASRTPCIQTARPWCASIYCSRPTTSELKWCFTYASRTLPKSTLSR